MRAAALLALLLVVVLATLGSGAPHPAAGTTGRRTAAVPHHPAPLTSRAGPRTPAAVRRQSPDTRAAAMPVAADATHLQLAHRARAGDSGAALALVALLERCAQREELRGFMQVLARADPLGPGCTRDCERLDEVYDELERALARERGSAAECAGVPSDWIALRGEWLEMAARLGDAEARACYALAGSELAPPASRGEAEPWLQRWHAHALPWAWDALRRGEPRAALALARIYGSEAGGYASDAAELADSDLRLEYRFALLLTEVFELDPLTSEPAQRLASAGASLTPSEAAEQVAWVARIVPRTRPQAGLPARTPEACWQHFALFAEQ